MGGDAGRGLDHAGGLGRPLVDQLERGEYDVSTLLAIISGGAPLNSTLKDRFLAALPTAMVMDAVGASESRERFSRRRRDSANTLGSSTPTWGGRAGSSSSSSSAARRRPSDTSSR